MWWCNKNGDGGSRTAAMIDMEVARIKYKKRREGFFLNADSSATPPINFVF